MTWFAWAGIAVVIILAIEACYIMPDKMPWRRKRK